MNTLKRTLVRTKQVDLDPRFEVFSKQTLVHFPSSVNTDRPQYEPTTGHTRHFGLLESPLLGIMVKNEPFSVATTMCTEIVPDRLFAAASMLWARAHRASNSASTTHLWTPFQNLEYHIVNPSLFELLLTF